MWTFSKVSHIEFVYSPLENEWTLQLYLYVLALKLRQVDILNTANRYKGA